MPTPIDTVVSFWHSIKVELPIPDKLLGIVIVVSFEQFWKALLPIFFSPSASVRDVIEVQLRNAELLMSVTLPGMVTDVRLLQPSKV